MTNIAKPCRQDNCAGKFDCAERAGNPCAGARTYGPLWTCQHQPSPQADKRPGQEFGVSVERESAEPAPGLELVDLNDISLLAAVSQQPL